MKKVKINNSHNKSGSDKNLYEKPTLNMKTIKLNQIAKEGKMPFQEKDHTKRKKTVADIFADITEPVDHFSRLSLETICHILHYLPLYDIMKLESHGRKYHEAVTLHLRLITEIDFTEGELYTWMPATFNDITFKKLLSRCPNVVQIYGMHPCNLSKRKQREGNTLSVPGVTEALASCRHLDYVETCDIFLLEALITQLPHVTVGDFKNRNGHFPVPCNNKLNLVRNSALTSLQLHGVTISDVPRMETLQHLHLRFVKLSDPHPFRDFYAPMLRSFVMCHCVGPTDALKYVPLVTGLASTEMLHRLELTRVPFLGGLFQHVVEDRWRNGGFRNLEKVSFGACKHALEVDLGFLIIASANRIEEVNIQPALTKDSLFSSLLWADVDFRQFESLSLGYMDAFPEAGKWTNDELLEQGLADVVEVPAMLTDIGMNAAGRAFEYCRNLSVYNCPHLHHPSSWFSTGLNAWRRLRYVHIRRCHAIWLSDFCQFIGSLPKLESLYVEEMFREPPRGCSRVGLSAGTGLGVSSALVTNTGNEPPIPAPNAPPANNPGAAAAPVNQEDDNNDHPLDQPLVAAAAVVQPAQAENVADNADAAPEDNQDEVAAPEEEIPSPPPTFPEAPPDNEEERANVVSPDNNKNMDMSQAPCASGHSHSCIIGPTTPCCHHDQPSTSCSKFIMPTTSKEAGKGDLDADVELETEAMMRSSAELELDIVAADLTSTSGDEGSAEPAVITKCCHCGCVVQSPHANKSSIDQAGTSSAAAFQHKKTLGKGRGKGKSLRGSKKGIAKGKSLLNNQVHQSCQAVSEEIREAARKAKEVEAASSEGAGAVSNNKQTGNSTGQQSKTSVQSVIKPTSQVPNSKQISESGDSNQSRRQLRSDTQLQTNNTSNSVNQSCTPSGEPVQYRLLKRKVPTEDKCTSTSDPVIEDDHIPQLLTVKSQSLVNLSLRNVGVTDLVIDECPRLQIFSGSSCRVLKNVMVKTAPRLTRTSFAQCPHLREQDLLDELCMQTAERNRLIFLRPMHKYKPSDLARSVFSNANYNYHLCVIHDYSPNPEETLYNRRRVATWVDLFSNINFELLRFMDFPEADTSAKTNTENYPWGRSIYTMHGKNSNGSKWDLITDVPWLRTLSLSPDLPGIHLSVDDVLCGLYSPRSKGHMNTDSCLDILAEDIAEAREANYKLFNFTTVVYVNMCDVRHVAVADKYV